MENNKKYIRKSFWVHQYEKEEEFLSSLRAQGWKFINLYKGLPTKYEFEKCEPENVSYQLDYVTIEEDTQDYHQLFADDGWEEIMPWDGVGGKWYYFCKKEQNGKKEVIFTDQESKLGLINKLMMTYGIFYVAIMMLEINSFVQTIYLLHEHSFWLWVNVPISFLAAILVIWLTYCEVSMLRLKNKIQGKIKNSL